MWDQGFCMFCCATCQKNDSVVDEQKTKVGKAFQIGDTGNQPKPSTHHPPKHFKFHPTRAGRYDDIYISR